MKKYLYPLLILLFAGFLNACTKGSVTPNPTPGNTGETTVTPPTTTVAAPAAQTVVTTTISSTGFTAKWKKVTGADKYLFYLATDNQFTNIVPGYTPLIVTDTSIVISNLSVNTGYYFRVKASANNVTGNYSNTINVSTLAKQWVVSTFAGTLSNQGGYADGQGTAAKFDLPSGMTIDATDNLYVLDNNRVRKITPAGYVSTFAGSGINGTVDGTATVAQLDPYSITYDRYSGNLYIGSQFCIRKINSAGTVTTVAGNPNKQGATDGQGTAAVLSGVGCLSADASGNIYFYQNGNSFGLTERLRKLSATGLVSTINTTVNLGAVGGNEMLYYNNYLYLPNGFNYDVLKISTTGTASTIGSGGYQNGNISAAKFAFVAGITVDAAGNFYVIDEGNHLIREISTANIVSNFAGIYGGYPIFEGPALSSDMSTVVSIVPDSKGNFFVLDRYNNCIRKISYQ